MSRVGKGIVFLDRGNYTTCTIHLHGGTVTSFRVKNQEFLYIRQLTRFDHISTIRGGIKYAFPYFGCTISGPKHGFARCVDWKLESGPTTLKDGDVEAVLSLNDTPYTKAISDFKFKFSLKITLCRSKLIMSVKVENTSKFFPFYFTIMRHSIFKVDDMSKVEIWGLSKCRYYEFNPEKKNLKDPDPNSDKIVINKKEKMDVYIDAPRVVEVLNIDNDGRKLRVTRSDDACPDTLIYHPDVNTEVSIMEDDLSELGEEVVNFLGVGNGSVYSNIKLKSHEVWQSEQTIEIVDEAFEKRFAKYALLLINPWEMFMESCETSDVVL